MKAILPIFCALILNTSVLAEPYLDFGPMLGYVSETEANVWIKASATAEPAITFSKLEDLSDANIQKGKKLSAKKDFMTIIKLEGLEASQRYFYAVTLDGKTVTPRPYPSFTTAPPIGEPTRHRIAFTSCLGYTGRMSAAGWAQMDATSNADLLLLLGDDHYADSTERKRQLTAYFSHRSPAGFRAFSARVPTCNIWDDHDYGPNDSDGTAKGKETSLATFKEFWPNPSFGEPDHPGVYYKFSRSEIDFFMLDVRYNRSPDKMIDDGTKTMLGARQLEWLKTELKASKAKVKIVGSGSEWQLNGHTDSWTSYPREREDFFSFIEKERITGILLISGDRHFTGGYQIGGKLIEVTSGPLGSKNFPTKNLPEMFFNQGVGKMFSVFDIDTSKEEPKITLEVHRAGDGIVQKIKLPWKAVLGKEKLERLPVEHVPEKKPFQVPFEK